MRMRTQSGHNPGNFRALLEFCVDAGDMLLSDHFSHAPKKAQWHSSMAQNDLTTCCGEWIQRKFIQEVLKACFQYVLMKLLIPLIGNSCHSFVLLMKLVQLERFEFILRGDGVSGVSGAVLSTKIYIGHWVRVWPRSQLYLWPRVRWHWQYGGEV